MKWRNSRGGRGDIDVIQMDVIQMDVIQMDVIQMGVIQMGPSAPLV